VPTEFKAGYAACDITPPVGVDLTGFIARTGPSTGIRDPLSARGLVLDDGRTRIALIACDVLGFEADFVRRVRAGITEATGIPASHALIAATHTHSGPATMFLQDCGERDEGYMQELEQRLVDLCVQAFAALEPARLAIGRNENVEGVHNRRRPGDMIDPEIGLLRVERGDGSLLALLVNYACHPTTLSSDNRLISADYPGLVRTELEAATGAPVLFLMGAIGDVGPVERGPASLERIGKAVARAALDALPKMELMAEPVLSARSEVLDLPMLSIPAVDALAAPAVEEPDRLGRAGVEGDALQRKIQAALARWAERVREVYEAGCLRSTVSAELQVICIGDVAIVTAPGELFCELGLQIKRGIDARLVLVCGFGNDNIGYIPARRAYVHGGYEIADAYKFYGYPAALAPEAGEQLVAAATRLAQAGVSAA
jgi:neutral ceramidase